VKDNIFVFVFRKSFSKHINKVICKIIGVFCNLSYAFWFMGSFISFKYFIKKKNSFFQICKIEKVTRQLPKLQFVQEINVFKLLVFNILLCQITDNQWKFTETINIPFKMVIFYPFWQYPATFGKKSIRGKLLKSS
jgi:hypothetical protein